uniref:Uncharacterized protein n=1 Tax=Romanomermis culicivorax TaxID=13658 RepID=A0A915KXX1_ROMCU
MANNMSLEEQIRIVDRSVKECDATRKQLEALLRKVDDLYDEIKHFRDFLSYEKYRRDTVSTGTRSSIGGSAPHTADAVCETLSALTIQITKEWEERLEQVRNTQIQITAPNM